VLGVSGSPIADGNTDRLVRRVLADTGLKTEFVKLWDLDLHPCKACLACAKTNVCTGFDDDWALLARKVVHADAFVVGGWMPFGILDAATKMFLERTYCLRHSVLLNAGKVGVAVITGTVDPHPAADDILSYFHDEGITPLGKVVASGVDPCWSCGLGETCVQGGTLPMMLSGYHVFNYPHTDRLPAAKDFKIVPDLIPPAVEEQADALAEAARLGALIAAELEGRGGQWREGLENALPGASRLPAMERLRALTEESRSLHWVRDDSLHKELLRLLALAERARDAQREGKAVVTLLAYGRAVLLEAGSGISGAGAEVLTAEARRAIIACYPA
jgi:multimeric flavodoxin WrbA